MEEPADAGLGGLGGGEEAVDFDNSLGAADAPEVGEDGGVVRGGAEAQLGRFLGLVGGGGDGPVVGEAADGLGEVAREP